MAAKSAWREQAITRAAEIRTLAASAQARTEHPPAVAETLATSIAGHLAVAEDAVQMSRSLLRSSPGAVRERTTTNLDAAEIDALLLAPASDLCGRLPEVLAKVRTYLRDDDPRRTRVEEIAVQAVASEHFEESDRDAVLAALRAANREERETVGRAGGVRTLLTVAIALVTFAALAIAILGSARPDTLPLCFVSIESETLSCPAGSTSIGPSGVDMDRALRVTVSPWDILLVELVGMFAAIVAAAVALRGFETLRSSFHVPLLLALLKLPTGALTAVLGLMLLRAGMVPGFSTLDSPAQITAWAVIFGYSQQLFTRLVDQRAQEVIKP